jgi:hypothetical protein
MVAMVTEEEISDSLPAGYHFGSLPFETGDDAVFNRYQFQRDCLSCHQLGNELTRNPRTPESWHQTIIRMHRYMGGKFDQELRQRRSVMLSTGFNGEPISVRPQFPVDARISDARITEYRLKQGNPHDTIIHPETGIMYSADQGYSHMAVTDPVSGESLYVSQYGPRNRFYVPGTGSAWTASTTSPTPAAIRSGYLTRQPICGSHPMSSAGASTIPIPFGSIRKALPGIPSPVLSTSVERTRRRVSLS